MDCLLLLTPYHVVHIVVANAPKYSMDSHYVCRHIGAVSPTVCERFSFSLLLYVLLFCSIAQQLFLSPDRYTALIFFVHICFCSRTANKITDFGKAVIWPTPPIVLARYVDTLKRAHLRYMLIYYYK